MTNPFDDSVADEYQNPFANNAQAEVQAPIPATSPVAQNVSYQTPEPSYTSANTTSLNDNYENYDKGSTEKKSGGFAAIKNFIPNFGNNNSNAFVDPVTGVAISEADLEMREAALAKKEREIEEKETRLANGTLQPTKSGKNFPPFLKWYSYHPDEDLPENARTQAKVLFFAFFGIGIIYAINWIGCLACLNGQAAAATSSPATKIVLSTIFLFIFYPLSYELVYFVYYNAVMTGKGLKFVCFLITYVIWGLMLVYAAIGIDDGGSVGWIQTINLFAGDGASKGIAVIALIFSLSATGMVVFLGFMFMKFIKFYRSEGFEKRTFSEAAQFTAEKARENPDIIMDVARDNPELIKHTAAAAAGSYTKFD
ncbi:hypothetical protein TRFO_22801 [Tritrichomonas foetus]|uniref:Secretory carrier membrane protein n=1 Tax=Tritrichomonas foetus TaxID=1144522 RepID=A0A1J4KB21_9EUKA|nr:hypothetical protein TRFO_22801 [Tritrichomonas foetus]|eukprot:OHT08615.1 hypothetical protein TRFO_22801 [Tritrichomonas foetus]